MSELGTARSGGLSGRHHFSFAAYQRLDRLEWGALRALNLYRLEPGAVRAPTFHAGFEIVTLVTGGCLRRIGTFAPPQLLRAGAAELISTGTGANLGAEAIGDEPASYVEIWVRSEGRARRARRQSRPVCPTGIGHPVATGPAPAPKALAWRAAAQLHRIILKAGETLDCRIDEGMRGYLAVLSGDITANGLSAEDGDAVALSGPGRLTILCQGGSEFLLIQASAEA